MISGFELYPRWVPLTRDKIWRYRKLRRDCLFQATNNEKPLLLKTWQIIFLTAFLFGVYILSDFNGIRA